MSQYGQKKITFLDLVWLYKFHFAFYILGISCLTFFVLYVTGSVPDELKLVNNTAPIAVAETPGSTGINTDTNFSSSTQGFVGEIPVKISIDKIGVDSNISNPNTTNINTLNNYLLHGAVRYPGSGVLANGNMFLFGHSTGIRIVNNQAFKTFNHLKDLNIGDEIKIDSLTHEYVYSVISVSLVDSDKALVDLSRKENMVTLSTCDVFGQKQQRFVVEAKFLKTQSLGT